MSVCVTLTLAITKSYLRGNYFMLHVEVTQVHLLEIKGRAASVMWLDLFL